VTRPRPAERAWSRRVAFTLAAGALAAACDHESQRGLEYMPDMAHSVPYDAYARNPVTRDGKTLQPPVAGTVPRGFLPFRYRLTAEDAARAGEELEAPAAPTPEQLAAGKALYETFCLVCHGQTGQGDGPLVPRIPNPPSYSSDRLRAFPPGRLYHVVTLGAGRMPGYASQIPPEQRWLIVHYVRALQSGGGTP
jgi:mono/diheme cytochrome c family protein